MMPLSMVNMGETKFIRKINGKDDTKRFLENLGFVEGSPVTVVSEMAGNVIVNVRETRVAIDRAMAMRIMV